MSELAGHLPDRQLPMPRASTGLAREQVWLGDEDNKCRMMLLTFAEVLFYDDVDLPDGELLAWEQRPLLRLLLLLHRSRRRGKVLLDLLREVLLGEVHPPTARGRGEGGKKGRRRRPKGKVRVDGREVPGGRAR